MSNYNQQIQSNNTRLENLIDTANALPEAGGGGSNMVNVEIGLGVFSFCDANGNIITTNNVSSITYQVLEGIVSFSHSLPSLTIIGNYVTSDRMVRFLSDGGSIFSKEASGGS